MKTLRIITILFVAGLLTAFTQNAVQADTAAKPALYPHIVDVEFVKLYAKIPKGDDAVIIDARPTARKYDIGHVPTAISIPDRKFDKMTDLLPADKKTPLIFYCGGYKCKLSPNSAAKAVKLGYTNVKLFQAGYPEWVKLYGSGPTAAKEGGATKVAIDTGSEPDTITFSSFRKIIEQAPGSVHLIDVRSPEEFKAGAFKGAINMSVDEVEQKVAELPSDKPIIFICSTGARSGEAYDIVKMTREKLEVYFLNAEITYGKDGSYKLQEPVA